MSRKPDGSIPKVSKTITVNPVVVERLQATYPGVSLSLLMERCAEAVLSASLPLFPPR